MGVIKITNKQVLDDLQARLILRLGRKISRHETLDLCLDYATENFEDILRRASSVPILTPAIADKIIHTFEKYADTPYNPEAKFESGVDDEIYSL